MRPVLILRPQPGADRTAQRARAMGLEPLICPLFKIVAVAWSPPEPAQFEAVMLTSANAAYMGGPALGRYGLLPCWCVGEATAKAARDAGFTDIHIQGPDGSALAAAISGSGHRHILHLAGRHGRTLPDTSLQIDHIIVYESAETGGDPKPLFALNPVILIHSPRAAATLARLVPAERRCEIDLIAISASARDAAGTGWRLAQACPAPDDAAMLALAMEMCQ